MDLGPTYLEDLTWSADGDHIVALSSDPDVQSGLRIYLIGPSSGTIEPLDLPVRSLGGKYAWDTQLFTSSAGRLFYPGLSTPAGSDIYSVMLDGTRLQRLTRIAGVGYDGTFDAVLSPDETQVAYVHGDPLQDWVVGADGSTPPRQLPGAGFIVGWQPVP